MAKALDVVKFIIEIVNSNPNEDLMTNLRLNKLLYFAQIGSSEKLGYFLIDDEFEAWKYGPVVREVYDIYKIYGRNGIPTEHFDRKVLSRQEQLYLLDVIRTFSKQSTSALVNASHIDDSPWDEAWKQSEKIISKDRMQQYKNDAISVKPFKSKFTESDFVGYRDASNRLVLPKELDYAD